MEGAKTLQAMRKDPDPVPHFAPASPLPISVSPFLQGLGPFPSSAPEPTRRRQGQKRAALEEGMGLEPARRAEGLG